jgi:hypothetical protein
MIDSTQSYKKITFVKTSEHWSGNFYVDGTTFYDRYGMSAERPGYDVDDLSTWEGEEYVHLNCCRVVHSDPKYTFASVAVWGNDDFGMVKYFSIEDTKLAEALYKELQQAPDITRELLLGKGFEYF